MVLDTRSKFFTWLPSKKKKLKELVPHLKRRPLVGVYSLVSSVNFGMYLTNLSFVYVIKFFVLTPKLKVLFGELFVWSLGTNSYDPRYKHFLSNSLRWDTKGDKVSCCLTFFFIWSSEKVNLFSKFLRNPNRYFSESGCRNERVE